MCEQASPDANRSFAASDPQTLRLKGGLCP